MPPAANSLTKYLVSVYGIIVVFGWLLSSSGTRTSFSNNVRTSGRLQKKFFVNFYFGARFEQSVVKQICIRFDQVSNLFYFKKL